MIRVELALVLAASLLAPFGGTAHRKTEEGNRHLAEESYDEALAAYTEAQVHAPDAPQLYYDVGNVLYRQGDFEGAAEAYTRALLEGPPDLAPLAAYNLGNARFRQQEYQDAVAAYRRALEAQPADRDAKRNLELALRELEKQQQQQQQQPQQDGQDQQPQDQPQQQGSEGGGDEEQQQQQPDQPGERPNEPPQNAPQTTERDEAGSMTPEQAARLLDGLAEEERRNLEQEARRRAAAARRETRERDW